MPYVPRKDITQQAIHDFQAVFSQFDLNNDQTIEASELALIIELLGDQRPSEEELRRLMQAACGVPPDDPIPTSMTFKHFLNFFAIFKNRGHTAVPDADIFRVLDRDSNGMVSSRDLMRTLNGFDMNIGQDEADAMADVASLTNGATEFGRNEFRDLSQRVKAFRQESTLASTLGSDSK